MDDLQAFQTLKDGDIRGLETLVACYQHKAIRVAFLVTHDQTLAEDVAQVALQVVQMDLVVFGDVFAFTAIDIFPKESAVLLRPALEAVNGYAFLYQCMPEHFGGYVEIIRTDGGSLCKEC